MGGSTVSTVHVFTPEVAVCLRYNGDYVATLKLLR